MRKYKLNIFFYYISFLFIIISSINYFLNWFLIEINEKSRPILWGITISLFFLILGIFILATTRLSWNPIYRIGLHYSSIFIFITSSVFVFLIMKNNLLINTSHLFLISGIGLGYLSIGLEFTDELYIEEQKELNKKWDDYL